MKKNKTMAYALAASLLVGGTFVGTKAWFMDKIDVASTLEISTGDLDIQVQETGNSTNAWKLQTDHKESAGNTKEGLTFDNLKPGDQVYKEIIVKNEGTLDATVTLKKNSDHAGLGTLNGLITASEFVYVDADDDGDNELNDKIDAIQGSSNVEFILKSGESAKIRLELNVDKNVNDSHNTSGVEDGKNFNSEDFQSNPVKLNDLWILDAVQKHQ